MNTSNQSTVDQPLTQLLYRMSLEPAGRWFMILGTGLEAEPPHVNIGTLQTFITGFQSGLGATGAPHTDRFFLWLRDEANAFPPEGWARFLLTQSGGNHVAAIEALLAHLHRYLVETRPTWFVKFNQVPQPSLFANGLGSPLVADVRLRDHVIIATGSAPAPSFDLQFSAFEMTDGYVLGVGLPRDVGTWWSGSGRRIAVMGSEQALNSVRGSTSSIEALISSRDEACALDATPTGVALASVGACGAVHIRDGQLVALSTKAMTARWSLVQGDRVLLLSGALFAKARELGVGPLPANLATAEPVAWAQSVDVPARRLAVSVALPPL